MQLVVSHVLAVVCHYVHIHEYIYEFNFLDLTLDGSLSFKFHLTKIGNKISRVNSLLHKLKHIFPSYLLRMIYNSLILPHMNYSLLAWGANCYSIELLQKKAVRVINFKSPLAHTEPILKGMDQLKLPDIYTCHLIKLYYTETTFLLTLKIIYQNMSNLSMTYVIIISVCLLLGVSMRKLMQSIKRIID